MLNRLPGVPRNEMHIFLNNQVLMDSMFDVPGIPEALEAENLRFWSL